MAEVLTSKKIEQLIAHTRAGKCKPRAYQADSNLLMKISLKARRDGSPSATASWVFRHKGRDKGMGAFPLVSLKEARETAAKYRDDIAHGRQPGEEERKIAPMTFEELAQQWFGKKRVPAWSEGHAAQYRHYLDDFILPKIGKKHVHRIDVFDVKEVLRPLWVAGTMRAEERVRGIIKQVLDAAIGGKLRAPDNPAIYAAKDLRRPDAAEPEHYPAVQVKDVPAFMKRLRSDSDIAAWLLEFQILTGARPSEARGAEWAEIDLPARVWFVPAKRMKKKKLHAVPLSSRAIEILEQVREFSGGGRFVFPAVPSEKPPSWNVVPARLAKIVAELMLESEDGRRPVPHGWRSAFSDWGLEAGFDDALLDKALAHKLSDSVKAAYQRTGMLDARRVLMQRWADYCGGEIGQVIALKAAS